MSTHHEGHGRQGFHVALGGEGGDRGTHQHEGRGGHDALTSPFAWEDEAYDMLEGAVVWDGGQSQVLTQRDSRVQNGWYGGVSNFSVAHVSAEIGYCRN